MRQNDTEAIVVKLDNDNEGIQAREKEERSLTGKSHNILLIHAKISIWLHNFAEPLTSITAKKPSR